MVQTCVVESKGDVKCDGVVNILDVVRVVNIILGDPATAYERWSADCNEDGDVNTLDVVGIVNVILGLGSCQPWGVGGIYHTGLRRGPMAAHYYCFLHNKCDTGYLPT